MPQYSYILACKGNRNWLIDRSARYMSRLLRGVSSNGCRFK